ncbi:hypothetical protein BGZ49_006797 [Haplosporangium sp. Z 27]|nr:hypothetical protein BGZ49_006797 [Haplosporangium sp. Z 27]
MNNQVVNTDNSSSSSQSQVHFTNSPPSTTEKSTNAPHNTNKDRSHLNARSSHLEQRRVSTPSVNSNHTSSSRRHSHTGTGNQLTKSRPSIRSNHNTNKLVGHTRRRRAKFVFGDPEHEVEDDESAHLEQHQQQYQNQNQYHQQQQQQDVDPSVDRSESIVSQKEQEQEQQLGQQLEQQQRGQSSTATTTKDQTSQENQDSGYLYNSETIPNVHHKNHPRRIVESSSSSSSSSLNSITKGKEKANSSSAHDQQFHQTETHTRNTLTKSQDQAVVSPQKPQSNNISSSSTQIPTTGTSNGADPSVHTPLEQPSKRLSRLLHPSRSTTSLPSLTRTTSRPVLTTVSPTQSNSNSNSDTNDLGNEGENNSIGSATVSALFATLKNEEQMLIAPVVDLVTKFLNPNSSNMRSRSHSNLAALTSSPSSHRLLSRYGTSFNNNSSNSGSNDIYGHGRNHHHGVSPPRTNDSGTYLISRFLPNSSLQPLSGSTSSKNTPSSSSSNISLTTSTSPQLQPTKPLPPQVKSPHIKRRRVPASLRMTLAAPDSEVSPISSTTPAPTAVSTSTSIPEMSIPSRPTTPASISSEYSSAEGRTQSPEAITTTTSAGPWNIGESMSRTQQKLMLQRASSHDDMDDGLLERREKALREMERIQKDYRSVRIYADPMMDSLLRCYQARKEKEEREEEQ